MTEHEKPQSRLKSQDATEVVAAGESKKSVNKLTLGTRDVMVGGVATLSGLVALDLLSGGAHEMQAKDATEETTQAASETPVPNQDGDLRAALKTTATVTPSESSEQIALAPTQAPESADQSVELQTSTIPGAVTFDEFKTYPDQITMRPNSSGHTALKIDYDTLVPIMGIDGKPTNYGITELPAANLDPTLRENTDLLFDGVPVKYLHAQGVVTNLYQMDDGTITLHISVPIEETHQIASFDMNIRGTGHRIFAIDKSGHSLGLPPNVSDFGNIPSTPDDASGITFVSSGDGANGYIEFPTGNGQISRITENMTIEVDLVANVDEIRSMNGYVADSEGRNPNQVAEDWKKNENPADDGRAYFADVQMMVPFNPVK